jgi:hypothetical protein
LQGRHALQTLLDTLVVTKRSSRKSAGGKSGLGWFDRLRQQLSRWG